MVRFPDTVAVPIRDHYDEILGFVCHRLVTQGPPKNNFTFLASHLHAIFGRSSIADPRNSSAIPPALLNRSGPNLTQIWAPILRSYAWADPKSAVGSPIWSVGKLLFLAIAHFG